MKIISHNTAINTLISNIPNSTREHTLLAAAEKSDSERLKNKFLQRTYLRILVTDILKELAHADWQKAVPISREIHCEFSVKTIEGLTRTLQKQILAPGVKLINRILKKQGVAIDFENQESFKLRRSSNDVLPMNFYAVRQIT
jgi:hypothetical protein